MKLTLAVFLMSASLFLASCSKDNMEDDDSETYITITNNFGTPLQNLTIGVMINSKTELVKNIGTLDQNAVSEKVQIKHKNVSEVFLFFDHYTGKTYMVLQPFGISQGTTSNLTLLSIANVLEIQKTSDKYPK
ncbi:MAG TPA: hypothetical protein VIK74_03260 [Parasegetibacter sp.]|jgi:hypothetical protein